MGNSSSLDENWILATSGISGTVSESEPIPSSSIAVNIEEKGFYLYFSRDSNYFPISEFHNSEGDGICLDSKLRNKD
jgi:hypothetical protein